jgi:hypothetical protein
METLVASASSSLADVCERLKRVAPEVLDLATARTETEFSAAFDLLLERAVRHLEANAENFETLGEVGLSAVLCGCLSGTYGIRATQESHSNGHVDLVIEINLAAPIQRRLAEAKIESGPVNHQKGLGQLLTRYITGRECTSWLLLYVRGADIKARMQSLRTRMDIDRPHNQTSECENHRQQWCFVSPHKHSSGEIIRVVHVGCNLHHPKPGS